jgi:hypothetical protein
MIDLSKEAEEYRKKWLFLKSGNTINDTFIAGANSKYVQAKIIQAQIDVLQTLILGNNNDNTAIIFRIKIKIFELQQQLKQLENE